MISLRVTHQVRLAYAQFIVVAHVFFEQINELQQLTRSSPHGDDFIAIVLRKGLSRYNQKGEQEQSFHNYGIWGKLRFFLNW